ncbi:ATP-dependent helicase [Sediminibacterium soli]|uniref:ATP-dependent helicase n=1 Tax=Sediminibacterium soli TaxID=2698829 RepID=UPI0013793C2E|nr:ATP-dependent DNA helicase [Sediminibacterium soli]NCI47743.1 ATP-dependent helicase [Sediminibacterium soli]
MHQREQFDIIYQALNEEQKRAVDTIEGPVMVIAGPGTGKTQILGARIGKILLDTDTQPQNILCLTYTDAGVVAMRKRLLKFIGPDAYKVNIYTFHAFCNDIIQENLSLFEKTSLEPVSDLEKIDFFKQLIDGFPKNHPLKRYRGDVYFEIRNLQQLFSNMKREGWTPQLIGSRIDEYLNDIPNREEFVYKRAYKQFRAGDPKTSRIEEAKEKMEKLRAAVNEFDRFQQIMRSRNRYDFDDMINWVIRAFEENPLLLSKYQEQFLYILVDEYQDTSGTQNRLVQLLINYWEHPNVFVVGDDDQSIYRFQGANIENMMDFASSYQDALQTIVLTSNYRSTQPILDVSKTLIDRNEERLIKKIDGLSKELRSSNSDINTLTHAPSVREYQTQREEMIHITLELEKLISAGTPPGAIGIIYKENRYGEELTTYLTQRKIPVYSKRSLNLLELPLARKMVLLLKYLAAEQDIPYGGDEMLFEILHFDWFGIAPIEIAKLSAELAGKPFAGEKFSLRRLLFEKVNAPARDLFSKAPTGMKPASDALEKLIGQVPNTTLISLVENCFRHAGILSWVMQDTDKHFHLRVLGSFFDFVKDEAHRRPSMTLEQLVNLFRLMEKEDLSLPLVQVSGSDKGVNLLTVHGSKGLEYEHVFLAGCNAGNWEKKRKPGGGYAFPDTMFSSQPKHTDEEELRRLFYVGLTRARLHLHISYSRFKNDGKEWEPSMFIEEMQEIHKLPVQQVIIDRDTLSEFAMIRFHQPQAPELEKTEADFITQLLDKFVMNVTALNNYLKCPLQFYFLNLVRVPRGKSEALEFGSAVHYALEKLFSNIQQTGSFAGKADFIADFEVYMNRHRENFTKEEFARRMEYGHEVLGNYYDQYIDSWNRVVAVERNIRNVVVQGVPLKGKLDKLEFDGHAVNVVDYKTGDIDKARDKLLPPGEKNPPGGDYWRQAVFYKLLVDNYEQKNWKVISTEFDFVEPDKKKVYRKEKILIGPEDTATVTQQIKTVWQKIQDRDFYQGCGKEDCHWCNFVKTNHIEIALHDLAGEEQE